MILIYHFGPIAEYFSRFNQIVRIDKITVKNNILKTIY